MLELSKYNSEILKDISFKVEDDLTILGANGSGKSTLAKVLCGIINSHNCVSFNKENIYKLSKKNRVKMINYIPSKLEIFDKYLSVKEFLNLSFLKEDDVKANEILQLLKIAHLKNQSCKSLSSGESQLLLIASAIAHNAKYTILDEPTANLDQIKTKEIFNILNNKSYLQNKLLITHDLNFAYKLGFDILFLKEGKIVFNGTSEEFFRKQNLENFFKNSVKVVDGFIVGNL